MILLKIIVLLVIWNMFIRFLSKQVERSKTFQKYLKDKYDKD